MTDPRQQLLEATVLTNPYIPVIPHARQAVFLTLDDKVALYGGAAGGGKSVALLASALMFCHLVPNYSALLLRRSFTDLNLPSALIPLSHRWLDPTDARWSQSDHRWYFPNGATLSFGYLDTEADLTQYQSAEFQFVGFDELTQFTQYMFKYMFSRTRKIRGMNVPIRIRGATNPGGVGHEWVKQYFITEGRPFISAKLEDNPHLDQEEYELALAELPFNLRQQLRYGNWDIKATGNMFSRSWFETIEPWEVPALKRIIRRWDLAATTVKKEKKRDPDYTAGVKMALTEGNTFVILDVTKFREDPGKNEKRIRATANADGHNTKVRMEQEGGASGKSLISHYRRNVLREYDFKGIPSSGDKITRGMAFAAACEHGDVKLMRGAWINSFLDELESIGADAAHDDQYDAAAGAFRDLASKNDRWNEETLEMLFTRSSGIIIPEANEVHELLKQYHRGDY